MAEKDPPSKAKEIVTDVVEYFKSPPAPEPELNALLAGMTRKGKYYYVPGYGKMSHKQYNAFVYMSNITILGKKKRPFEIAVNRYNLQVRKLKLKNVLSFRRSDLRDDNRDSLESQIRIMLENWELEYRDNRNSDLANKELGRIRKMQEQLIRTKPKSIGEIFGGTFYKEYYDIIKLDEASKLYARKGGKLRITRKKEKFTGNAHDLIDFYEDEIDFIEENYLDDMNDRVKSNTYYLNKLK